MLKGILDLDLFKAYHPGTKSFTGSVASGAGNDPIALAVGGAVLVVMVVLILYFRKRYKQKYNY